MKKKTLIFLLTAAVTASLLAGCGNTAEPVERDSVVTGEEDADVADVEDADADEVEASGTETEVDEEETAGTETEVDEEETANTETEVDEEETPGAENGEQAAEAEEEPAEPETVNWLEEHEITITPQGDCTVNLYSYDSYEEDYVDDYEAGLHVTISETTEGVDEGLKKVVAEITIDLSGQPGTGALWNIAIFDRYTGTYFRLDSKTKKAVRMGDEYYDVRTERDSVNSYPMFYRTITLTCPADYDGTVVWIGYMSPEQNEKNKNINLEARTYTMDEMPLYVDGYRCFTLTDE